MYSGYTSPPLMVQRKDVIVKHLLNEARYDPAVPSNISKILEQEVYTGKEAIRQFTLQHFNTTPKKR